MKNCGYTLLVEAIQQSDLFGMALLLRNEALVALNMVISGDSSIVSILFIFSSPINH